MLAVSRSAIADYAIATADHNPIHSDAAFAATTPYGRPIAHGTLALNAVWAAADAIGYPIGGAIVRARFVAPTFDDDRLTCELGDEADGVTRFEVLTADRRVVIAGTLSRGGTL